MEQTRAVTSGTVEGSVNFKNLSDEEKKAKLTGHPKMVLEIVERALEEFKDPTTGLYVKPQRNFKGYGAVPDPNDRGTIEIAHNKKTFFEARKLNRYNSLIRNRRDLLDSKWDGECTNELCGFDIPIKRFEANPTARFCIECQSKLGDGDLLTNMNQIITI